MNRVILLLAVLAMAAGIYCLQKDWVYMATNLFCLAAPAFLLFGFAWPRVSSWYKVSYITILLLMWNLCVLVEYVAIQRDWWDFSEAMDRLLPWRVGKIPLEEFAFWFSGCAEVILLYLALALVLKRLGIERGELDAYFNSQREKARIKGTVRAWLLPHGLWGRVYRWFRARRTGPESRLDPVKGSEGYFKYARGAWFPAWTLTVLVFVIASVLLVKGSLKKLNAWALLLTFLAMNLIYLIMEYNGISRGHWIWNEERILGVKVGVIPVEELGLYISAAAFPNPLVELCHDFLIRVHATDEDKARRERKRGYRAFVSMAELRAEVDQALGRTR